MELTGSRCLVVGGARRLGRQIALGLAAGGGAICVASRGGDVMETTLGELERAGAAAALPVRGDVGTPRGAAALVKAAAAALGGLDVLVFAASGPFVPQRPEALDEAAWDASFDVIAKGFFFAACAAREVFAGDPASGSADATENTDATDVARQDHGAIPAATRGVVVAITDYLGLHPWAAFAAHGAAKAAQIHLVKELARAWAADGVRVCGVAPGPVDLQDDEHRAATLRAAAKTESERLVTPAQVSAAVRSCIENDGMTGVNVVVDAGSLPAS
jgi:NAD(P)-dependent dehydrogenase (short-subunit alcohol dehydrogenase family)